MNCCLMQLNASFGLLVKPAIDGLACFSIVPTIAAALIVRVVVSPNLGVDSIGVIVEDRRHIEGSCHVQTVAIAERN